MCDRESEKSDASSFLVRSPGELCPRFPLVHVPHKWKLDSNATQYSAVGMACLQVRPEGSIAFNGQAPDPLYCRILNNRHMFDATEIFRTLQEHKRESFLKLGFYLLSFFYCKCPSGDILRSACPVSAHSESITPRRPVSHDYSAIERVIVSHWQ